MINPEGIKFLERYKRGQVSRHGTPPSPPYWSLSKIVNHCGIHSVISSGFAACLASCFLHVAKLVLISEWMPQ